MNNFLDYSKILLKSKKQSVKENNPNQTKIPKDSNITFLLVCSKNEICIYQISPISINFSFKNSGIFIFKHFYNFFLLELITSIKVYNKLKKIDCKVPFLYSFIAENDSGTLLKNKNALFN